MRIGIIALVMVGLLAGAAAAADVGLTSIGQSPDAMMVRVLLKQLGVDADFQKLMSGEDAAGYQAVIAVVGGSSKGMGAAGIDKQGEMDRAEAVLQTAREEGVHILVMHVGGSGRRGTLSDPLIELAVPYADELIVAKGGNEDGIFDELTQGMDIQIRYVDTVRDAKTPLEEILSGWSLL
ncbi:MAG: DUF6305 family protein [Synergistales bacterium]|nr:DUF6305 family protein [Synergistales bacterium]